MSLVYGGMGAFAHPAGIAVVDEARFPDGLDDLAQRVMYNPVAERRGADQPAFGLEDIKVVVRAGPVGLGLQFFLQAQQVPFQVVLKICHGGAVALAAPRQPVGPVEVFETANLRIEILICFHCVYQADYPSLLPGSHICSMGRAAARTVGES